MLPDKTTEEQLFEKYISDKKVLIADTSPIARDFLARILVGMGAIPDHLVVCASFNVAEEEMARVKPLLVITDYDMGKKCGLDLLQKQKTLGIDAKKSLFVLVTGNTSQSAVARAAEEDVDTYVIKPFTPLLLRMAILRAAVAKIDPGQYLQLVDKAKALLAENKFIEAEQALTEAKGLERQPSLACYYMGQVHAAQKKHDAAIGEYQEGLKHNKIHYKCLLGLYESYMETRAYPLAYETMKRLSNYYPPNAQRLAAVLKLAIMTQAYDDVERFYRVFTNVQERNEEMVKYVCAALVVCGKYYLQRNIKSRAEDLFKRSVETSGKSPKIIREVVVSLAEAGLQRQSEDFMNFFAEEAKESADYLTVDLLVGDKTQPRSTTIEKARALITKGIHDPLIYTILIKRSVEAGMLQAAQDLQKEAIKRWPRQKEQFDALLSSDPAKALAQAASASANAASTAAAASVTPATAAPGAPAAKPGKT